MRKNPIFAAFQALACQKPKAPYQPRVLITANDRRRAGLQGPPAHLPLLATPVTEPEIQETAVEASA